MCRLLFNKGSQMQKLLIGLILIVNYSDGLISTVDIRRLMESIILLPSVKKGTDSRVGLGFHLGHHADIQTIFEVGPQKFTKPLRNHVEYSSNAHKRMAKQFNYGHALKRKTNGYGHLEGQKDDFSTPQVYLGRPHFGIKNQFPLPPQPIYLNGDHS